FPGQQVEVEAQVLDQPAAELDVAVSQSFSHARLMLSGQGEHLAIAVHSDHPPRRADDLCGDEADLAAARAEVKDGIAGPDIGRRVAAAVVALQHLGRDGIQVARLITDRAAQGRLYRPRPGTVALADGFFRSHDRSFTYQSGHHFQPPLNHILRRKYD